MEGPETRERTRLDRLDNAPTIEVTARTPVRTFSLTIIGGARERLEWTALNPQALKDARERFKYWSDNGYWAYTVDGEDSEAIRDFRPDADMVMRPQMQGG